MADPKRRKPWMKFYPADWQADDGLKQCSLAAQGLWISMIAIMHKSELYGHLLIARVNPTVNQLAASIGKDVKSVRAALEELESWRVFSRTGDGVIYSRRMIADAEKEERDRTNGSSGGNPQLRVVENGEEKAPLKPAEKATVKQGVNPPDKVHIPEARNQKEETKATPSTLLASQPAIPSQSLWSEGLGLLRTMTGKSEGQCRGQIGRWRKALREDDATLFGVIHEAQTLGLADPMAWLERAVQQRSGQSQPSGRSKSSLAWMLDEDAPPPFTIDGCLEGADV